MAANAAAPGPAPAPAPVRFEEVAIDGRTRSAQLTPALAIPPHGGRTSSNNQPALATPDGPRPTSGTPAGGELAPTPFAPTGAVALAVLGAGRTAAVVVEPGTAGPAASAAAAAAAVAGTSSSNSDGGPGRSGTPSSHRSLRWQLPYELFARQYTDLSSAAMRRMPADTRAYYAAQNEEIDRFRAVSDLGGSAAALETAAVGARARLVHARTLERRATILSATANGILLIILLLAVIFSGVCLVCPRGTPHAPIAHTSEGMA
jgi:hypothetical protein